VRCLGGAVGSDGRSGETSGVGEDGQPSDDQRAPRVVGSKGVEQLLMQPFVVVLALREGPQVVDSASLDHGGAKGDVEIVAAFHDRGRFGLGEKLTVVQA
jgi:hypothetical protein